MTFKSWWDSLRADATASDAAPPSLSPSELGQVAWTAGRAEAEKEISNLKAQLSSQKTNAICNCAPADGWTLECGLLVCKCRCHDLETEIHELKKL